MSTADPRPARPRGRRRRRDLFSFSHRFPLTRQDIGCLVRALAALLDANAEPDAIIRQGGEIWLEDPPAEGS